MKVVTVNYSLNNTYFVSHKAFEELVVKASKNVSNSKLISFEVVTSEVKNDYSIIANILIKKGISLEESIVEFQKEIENYSQNLIDSKPQNISFNIEGTY